MKECVSICLFFVHFHIVALVSTMFRVVIEVLLGKVLGT
jgi:hypothetical protein